MSKSFKIVVFILFLYFYYSTVPSIIFAHYVESPLLQNPFFGSFIVLITFLFPLILLGIGIALIKRRHR